MQDLWQIAVKTIKGQPFRLQQLGSGNAGSIMRAVLSCQDAAQQQTKAFADRLKTIYGRNRRRLLYDLYNTICANVRLRYDPAGVQLVRKPSNVVAERACDCKSYSLFISAVLANLGIKNAFRFVSFGPGREITHVYIIAYPDGGAPVVLDCNLRSFNKETNYYKKRDVMAQISAIGKLEKTNWRNGRSLAQMTDPELGLRIHIEGLKSDLQTRRVKNNPALAATIRAGIDYEGDLLKTYQAAVEKGGAYKEQADALIGAIEHDWKTGRYIKMSRAELLKKRAQEWDNGTRYYDDSYISGWLKKALKKAGSALKTVGKTVASATVKTVKATGKAIASSAKLAANITKMATIAPVAALTSKGREEIKKTAQDIKGNVQVQGQAIKSVTLAPVSSLVEEVLDNMMEAGPWFLYSYAIPESLISKYPETIQKKWKKQREAYDKIIKYIDVDKSKLNSIIRSSIQRKFNASPEEVVLAIMNVGLQAKKNDPEHIGEAATAAAGGVVALITAIVSLAATVVGLILQIIGAVKSKKELVEAGAAATDAGKILNGVSNSFNGSFDSEGKFQLNEFAKGVLDNVGKDQKSTYGQLADTASKMLAGAKGQEEKDYYNNLLTLLKQMQGTAGNTAIKDNDLYKIIDYMAAKDGIQTQLAQMQGNLANLEDVGAAYAGLLGDQYLINKALNLTTKEASQTGNDPLTLASGGAVTPLTSSTSGSSKAGVPWWLVFAGVGLAGALVLSGNKKDKKKKKNKR